MFKRKILRLMNSTAGKYLGLQLIRHHNLYPWQITGHRPDNYSRAAPKDATSYLRSDNPRLQELKGRYAKFDPKVTTPDVWRNGILEASDLVNFRRDNPYVWQVRGRDFNELAYALTYYALKATSARDLFDKISEDDLFGVHLFNADGHLISRDLLDSVREIDFIRSHIGLTGINILDIGAGYGRLAYRLTQVVPPGVRIYATDAIAESTFLSEFYLRFRGVDSATVIPLDEFDAFIANTPIGLATNIHSFSECTPAAIEWWVGRLATNDVRKLLIIPNHVEQSTHRCLTHDGADMELIFERHGYRVVVREPRHRDHLVQSYGIDPSFISLFELH